MMIDKRTFWIGVMTIVLAVLLAAHAMQPGVAMPVAAAQEVIDHRDWGLATARTASGGEVLYVLDKRNGQLTVLTWNTRERRPEFGVPNAVSLPTIFNP